MVVGPLWCTMRISAALMLLRLSAARAGCSDPPTVAYAFLTRDELPLWSFWEAYFAGCPAGTAIPIVHSQESISDAALRNRVMRDVERLGGFVLAANETRAGNPRFSW